jgi:lysozyme
MDELNKLSNFSAAGCEALQDLEGTRFVAYKDIAGIWTCGVGHTGPDVKEGTRADQAQVMKWLQEDTTEAAQAVNRLVKVKLTQNQFDALVIFVYNIGETAFAASTLLKLLNSGDYAGAAKQFPRWDMAGGQHSPGLLKRRLFEKALFERT